MKDWDYKIFDSGLSISWYRWLCHSLQGSSFNNSFIHLIFYISYEQVSYLLFGICLFISCDNAKEKTKEAINKTGETVGQSASEFAKGVKTGVEKTFEYSVVLSDDLKAKGLETGKLLVSAGEAKSDNILSVYFIFLKDFKGTVSIKVYDEKGEEYGRTSI